MCMERRGGVHEGGGGGECIIHKCKYLCTYFSTVGVCVCTYVCSDVLV